VGSACVLGADVPPPLGALEPLSAATPPLQSAQSSGGGATAVGCNSSRMLQNCNGTSINWA